LSRGPFFTRMALLPAGIEYPTHPRTSWLSAKLGDADMLPRTVRLLPVLALLGLETVLLPACQVDSVCYTTEDCPDGRFCDTRSGECVEIQCHVDADCGPDFLCIDGRCVPGGTGPLDCPEDMVSVEDAYCIDIYEASRPDATPVDPGSDGSFATSRPGVLPWFVGSNQEAQQACEAAGKDLCTETEWSGACRGPEGLVYAYGNEYDPLACNGIDTYCHCDESPCQGATPCPFPRCYDLCGADLHLIPTGALPECTNAYGVFDMNGNLWEHVKGGNGQRVRGGAFNCRDSATLHRCAYIPATWTPSARGFRCCWRPEPGP